MKTQSQKDGSSNYRGSPRGQPAALTISSTVDILPILGIRAYDAVQLATALETTRVTFQLEPTQMTLVSADLELNAAAVAEGLRVEDPNTH